MSIKTLGMCCCLLCCASYASELTRINSAPQLFHENSLSKLKVHPCVPRLLAEISQCSDKEEAEFSAPELPLPNEQGNLGDDYSSQSFTSGNESSNKGEGSSTRSMDRSDDESSEIASEEKGEEDRKYHEYLRRQRKRGNLFGTIELRDDEVEFKQRSSSEDSSSISSDDSYSLLKEKKTLRILSQSSGRGHSPISPFCTSKCRSSRSVSPLCLPCLPFAVGNPENAQKTVDSRLGTSLTVLRPSVHGNNGSGSATGTGCGSFSNQCTPNKTPELSAFSQS